MNVIDKVKEIISSYPRIDEFVKDTVHIDFTTNEYENVGLSSNGETVIKEDVLGNKTYAHNFILYAVNQATYDYDRLKNSDFLLELGYYLDTIKKCEITASINGQEYAGMIESITASNAMLYSVLDGDKNQTVMYQVQIKVTYKIFKEE